MPSTAARDSVVRHLDDADLFLREARSALLRAKRRAPTVATEEAIDKLARRQLDTRGIVSRLSEHLKRARAR